MAHVFISYAREDQDFAEVVQAKLEKAGHTVELDLDLLSAGDDWGDKLDAAIRGAHALVLVLSAESRKSEYVTFEWSFALGAGVRVIPIALEETELHPRLRVLQRLDFTNKARPWDRLYVELQKAEQARAIAPSGDGPVAQAVRALDSLDAEERAAGIEALAQADGEEARKALAGALGHPLADVRIAAAKAFPDRKDPRILRGLVDDLTRDRSPDKLDAFAEALEELGAATVPEVMAILAERTDLTDSERSRLVSALGKAKEPRVVEALLQALNDPASDVRMEAAHALGDTGGEGVAAALQRALQDPDEGVRVCAADSLGQLGDRSAASALLEALAGDVARVRTSAARALGGLADGAAVPALTKALADKISDVQFAAAEALGQLGDPTGPAFLQRQLALLGGRTTLYEKDDQLMRALIDHGVEAAFPAIERLLVMCRGGRPPVDSVKALAARGLPGRRLLSRVLLERDPADPGYLAKEISEHLLRSGDPEALEAVREWRKSQP